jgi:gamma-glutamylcyclotransferase
MSVYYFAFGSNMNKERMIEREAKFTDMQKGILKDWQLVFNKKSLKNNSVGFANIEPKIGSNVEGIIYKVTEKTLEKLDGFEGVPNHYQRNILSIENSENNLIDSVTYVANKIQIDNSLKPQKQYLEHLLAGKKFLSESYFSNLKNTETLD